MGKVLFIIMTLWLVGSTSKPVLAQNPTITVTSPKAGSCVAGNTTVPITWITDSPSPDRVAIGVDTTGLELGPWTSTNPSFFTSSATNGSYSWITPNISTLSAKLTLEGLTAESSSWGRGVSGLFAIDANPPVAPVLKATKVSDTSLSLTWEPVTDEGCATLSGYKVYSNDSLVETLPTVTTAYTLTNLPTNTIYALRVEAFDAVATTKSNTQTLTLGVVTSPSPSPSASPTVSPTASTAPTTPFTKINVEAVTATTATVTFESDIERDVTLFYGLTEKYGKTKSVTKKESETVWFYTVELADLQPDSTYHFLLKTKTVKSANNQFRTKKEISDAPPVAVTSIQIGEQPISDTEPEAAKVVEQETIALTGNTKPNTKVVITVHSRPVTYETVSDSEGNWTFLVPTRGLESGNHEITVASRDTKGKVGKPNKILKFSLVPKARAAQNIYVDTQAGVSSAFGQAYGRAFLAITIVGTLFFIIKYEIQNYFQRKNSVLS